MERTQEHINKVKEIQRITQSILSQISVDDGQDIVAFIGPAKSGKSTLINCLLGNPLETKYDPGTEETTIVRKAGGLGPPIGNTESSIPQQYSGKNWHMVDFPGFGNSTRPEQEIASAMAYAEVMRSQKSVRFVLVVPIGMIKNPNPIEFYKLLNNIVTLCPNLSGSFCIVATKSNYIRIAWNLNRAMKLPFSEANEVNAEIINIAQLAIKRVLQLKHCIDFNEPVGNPIKNFIPPNLQEIVDLINTLKGTKIETETPVSISDHSKLQLVELSSAIESQLRNEIKNIYKYFDKQELLRNQDSRPSELFQIIDYLQKSSDYDSFIREIQKSDFNNLFLIDNLKAITYVQSIMKNFRIDGYWHSRDEDEIFKTIRAAICQIANKNKNLKVETIKFNKRLAETAEENLEHDKKIKYAHNPKYPSQEERSLEKLIKGTYEENKQIQRNKNKPYSKPMGNTSHTVPISIENSPTSDDINHEYSEIQTQSPTEIKLLISQMGPQGHFQEERCANCVCEQYEPRKCNKNESHSKPIRNSMNNSPTGDDIKDKYSRIQPQSPIDVTPIISQISPQYHFQEADSLEKHVNENKLYSEPTRNASHTEPISIINSPTSDDIKNKYLVIRNDNKPQSAIEIKLLISQMGSQRHFPERRCANCVCEQYEPIKRNKNEHHSKPMGNPSVTLPISINNSQTSDDIIGKYPGAPPQSTIEMKLISSPERLSLDKRVHYVSEEKEQRMHRENELKEMRAVIELIEHYKNESSQEGISEEIKQMIHNENEFDDIRELIKLIEHNKNESSQEGISKGIKQKKHNENENSQEGISEEIKQKKPNENEFDDIREVIKLIEHNKNEKNQENVSEEIKQMTHNENESSQKGISEEIEQMKHNENEKSQEGRSLFIFDKRVNDICEKMEQRMHRENELKEMRAVIELIDHYKNESSQEGISEEIKQMIHNENENSQEGISEKIKQMKHNENESSQEVRPFDKRVNDICKKMEQMIHNENEYNDIFAEIEHYRNESSQMITQCQSQEGGSLEKRELSSEPKRNASQTSDEVIENSSQGPYENPLQGKETSKRPQNHGIMDCPLVNYYNPDRFKKEQTNHKEKKPKSEPIRKASNPGQNSQTSDDMTGNSSPNYSNYNNPDRFKNKQTNHKEKKPKSEPIRKASNPGQNSQTSDDMTGNSSPNYSNYNNSDRFKNKQTNHKGNKPKSEPIRKASTKSPWGNIFNSSRRKKKENDDKMEVSIERRQSNGRRHKDNKEYVEYFGQLRNYFSITHYQV